MAMMIFPGGRRSKTAAGKVEDRYCNSHQWVKTRDVLPQKAAPILYLEYPSDEPSGTVRQGHYDRRRRKFINQESGEATPKDLVIAWMPIPKVPVEVYAESGF